MNRWGSNPFHWVEIPSLKQDQGQDQDQDRSDSGREARREAIGKANLLNTPQHLQQLSRCQTLKCKWMMTTDKVRNLLNHPQSYLSCYSWNEVAHLDPLITSILHPILASPTDTNVKRKGRGFNPRAREEDDALQGVKGTATFDRLNEKETVEERAARCKFRVWFPFPWHLYLS